MATFRFRSNRWQARVRRQGHPEQTRSFLTHKEAEQWARACTGAVGLAKSDCGLVGSYPGNIGEML